MPGDLPESRVPINCTDISIGDGGKVCEFAWTPWSSELRAIENRLKLIIGGDEYQQARQQPRFSKTDLREYSRYVVEGCSVTVIQAAAFFRERSKRHGFLTVQEMEDVVSFTRGIRYLTDQQTRDVEDWANFPVETLYDEAGDCEDHAILAAAVLWTLGHDVALFWLEMEQSAHIALGYHADGLPVGGFTKVKDGREFAYVETVPTRFDANMGDITTQFLSELKGAEIIPTER